MYFTHAGGSAADLAVPGTFRQDISDVLFNSMAAINTVLGLVKIGAPFGQSVCRWTEDKLNTDLITDVGNSSTSTVQTTQTQGAAGTLLVSNADGAVVDIGFILADVSATLGGISSGEQISVTGKVVGASTTSLQVTRGFNLSTNVTHAASAVWSIIGAPIPDGSSLGPDMSRARVAKFNYITRFEGNVILTEEAIDQANAGYSPGVNDEFGYQFDQRLAEKLRIWNKSIVVSKPYIGTNGSAGQSAGDYSTCGGIHSFLDTTMNATSALYDWSAQGVAPGAIDTAINYCNDQLYRNGARDDWFLAGPRPVRDVGKLYADRIRLVQDDTTRGFSAQTFRTDLANEYRILLDAFIQDTAPYAEAYLLDSARMRIRPWLNFMYILSAPSLSDSDATRFIIKHSFEMRNTGSDTGQAHYLITKMTP